MSDCDCCLLGCLCGACCAAAMDDDDRRRRRDYQYQYHNPPVYVRPVVVTTANYATAPSPTSYGACTATPAPQGAYYYPPPPLGNNVATAYPAYDHPPYAYAQPKV